ncbi:MAG: cohesin domain-containing protein [Chloroflexota bacterium]
MIINPHKVRRSISYVIPLALILTGILLLPWASPATAQNPTGISIQIEGSESAFRSSSVASPPVFEEGESFVVSIVAQNVEDPGIFGAQFELTYDTAHLEVADGGLTIGSSLEPAVVARSNSGGGLIEYAVSRQGSVDNVSGNVVLAQVTFEALASTEPPEGQTTIIHLQNVKLGAKGGLEVEVGGLVDLEVIIRQTDGDISGTVWVEGRAADQQAGHTITDGDLLSAITAEDGSFIMSDAEFGTYDLTASSPGFLAATCQSILHELDVTELATVTLLAGDINGDDQIDIADATAVGIAFGSTAADEISDLNDDAVVDVLDLILMAANYGQTSATNPWICEMVQL